MPSMSTPRAGGQRRLEHGFSMLELVVVVMLMGIFAIAVQTSMSAFLRTTKVTEDKTSVVGEVRVAEEAVARDMRAANPIDDIDPAPVSDYKNKVTFSVFCSLPPGTGDCGADGLKSVTYRLTGNRFEQVVGSKTRVLVGPGGPPAVPVGQQVGAVVNAGSEPIFTYYDKDGVAFNTEGQNNSVTTRRIHDCTKAVRIHLKVISEARNTTTPYNLVTTVELRNFNEVSGC